MANDIIPPPPTVEEVAQKKNEEITIGKQPPTLVNRDVSWKYNPDYGQMVEFLGVKDEDRFDEEVAEKVSFLRDFTKADNETDAKVKIKEIIKSLGVSYRGKELVKHLYQYARLSADKERIDKELSLLVEKQNEQSTQGEHPTPNESGGA